MTAAGLVIEQVDGSTVTGWIAVSRLTALAELDGVERVMQVAGMDLSSLDTWSPLWN